MNVTTSTLAAEFAATATQLSNGKRLITVTRNGEPFDTRTTANAYSVINLQVWEGAEHAGKVAPRYSRKALPVGRAIEYGRCAGSVPIVDVVEAAAPEAPLSWCQAHGCIHHV